MNPSVTIKEVAAGYLVAAVVLCLGIYFGLNAEGEAGTIFIRGFYSLAGLIVLKFTFAWGRIRGFAVRSDNGHFVVSHVLRSLVMSAIMWAALLFLTAPFMVLAFKLTR